MSLLESKFFSYFLISIFNLTSILIIEYDIIILIFIDIII